MQALRKTRPAAGLELVDVPVPVPEADSGDVLVEVSATGICGSDLHVDDWTSSYAFITGSIPLIEEDGYFVGNGSVGLKLANGIEISAGVNNILDQRYLIQGNASLATLGYAERIFARPRNWFAQLSTSF